jgi:hypothetical protein
MKNVLRNSITLFGGLLLIMGLLVAFYHSAKAQPSSVTIQTSATATTTVAFLTSGTASSTYQIDSNGAFSTTKIPNMQPIDSVNVYVQLAASSSATTLIMTPQWSNNNIDWYGFNQQTVATVAAGGVLPLASTTITYQWNPGTTATSSMVFTLPAVAAQHERVIYGTTGANGAVYSEYDLKRLSTTP